MHLLARFVLFNGYVVAHGDSDIPKGNGKPAALVGFCWTGDGYASHNLFDHVSALVVVVHDAGFWERMP